MSTTQRPQPTKAEQVIAVLSATGMKRTRDLEALGVSREYLRKLADGGLIVRETRGVYSLPGREITIHHSLVEAAVQVPHGVICLLSALRFHDLTTQSPFEVWIAIENNTWSPRLEYPPLRVIRLTGASLAEGIEEHQVEGVTLRVYSLAKTVVDCFKFRNRYGLDVALEALAETFRYRRATADEVWHFAQRLRMTNVMRPYLEAILYE